MGLSDIAAIENGQFLVLERDNQGGPDSAVKRIYRIDFGNFGLDDGTTIEKELFRNLMPVLDEVTFGNYEKMEGLAVTASGLVWVNKDNDGVDENSVENNLLNLFDTIIFLWTMNWLLPHSTSCSFLLAELG